MSSRWEKKTHHNGRGAQAETPRPKHRVCIVVPTQDSVKAMFAYDLAVMIGASTGHPDIELSMYFQRGTLIAGQRQHLAEEAVKDGVTHLLWLDSDMRFPPQTLIHLISREAAIVGTNYTSRRPPIKFVALKRLDDGHAVEVVTDASSSGLEPVEFTGMGVMLTEARIFTQMPKPWFFVEYMGDETGGHFSGEDVFFCRYAKSLGIPVYCDHDLSKLVRHVGEREYGPDDVSPERIARIRAAAPTLIGV